MCLYNHPEVDRIWINMDMFKHLMSVRMFEMFIFYSRSSPTHGNSGVGCGGLTMFLSLAC